MFAPQASGYGHHLFHAGFDHLFRRDQVIEIGIVLLSELELVDPALGCIAGTCSADSGAVRGVAAVSRISIGHIRVTGAELVAARCLY